MIGLVGGGATARGGGGGGGGGEGGWERVTAPVVASGGGEADHVRRLHRHAPADHQCSSTLVKHIKAPIHLVSSVPSLFTAVVG
ncbi:abscisic acid receptor PYL8-like [Panicum miliaceum]|uniref:Abscisic acid receptor PYL8-like n=1 Tax=Panicum miliaceum TaxID=4540 RepID=A0A3L6T8P1_PANMI|nr:abscisic acid receptor PYL8-like [Panicum miliaceum]